MTQKNTPYHHGDLRAALLAAATDLLTEQGIEQVSMRNLADAVGVSRSAAYRHFEDKAALLAAVAAEGIRQLSTIVKETAARHAAHPVQALHAVCVDYVVFAAQNPTHYRLMFGQAWFNPTAYPDLQTEIYTMLNSVTDIVMNGQAAGQIKDGPPMKYCNAAWALVHGLAFLIIDQRDHHGADVRAVADETFRTLLDGICTEPARGT